MSKNRGCVSVPADVYGRFKAAADERGIGLATLVELACADPDATKEKRLTADDARDRVRARFPMASCIVAEYPMEGRLVPDLYIVTRGKVHIHGKAPLGVASTRAEAWKHASLHPDVVRTRAGN